MSFQEIDAKLRAVTTCIRDKQMKDGAWPMRLSDREPNTVATALAVFWLMSYSPFYPEQGQGDLFTRG